MTLSAAGGTSPYKWTLASGSLPTGLSLSSAGTISGTPATAGSATFVVQANDSTIPTQAATAAFTLTVNPALSITTTSLPNAVASSSYTQNLAASGGTPGYTWSVASGSLPPVSASAPPARSPACPPRPVPVPSPSKQPTAPRPHPKRPPRHTASPLAPSSPSKPISSLQVSSEQPTHKDYWRPAAPRPTPGALMLEPSLTVSPLAPTAAISGTPTAAGVNSLRCSRHRLHNPRRPDRNTNLLNLCRGPDHHRHTVVT